jgi:hypothetical protein
MKRRLIMQGIHWKSFWVSGVRQAKPARHDPHGPIRSKPREITCLTITGRSFAADVPDIEPPAP